VTEGSVAPAKFELQKKNNFESILGVRVGNTKGLKNKKLFEVKLIQGPKGIIYNNIKTNFDIYII
jgi:hypothetical protein